jgi:hypothetical protein
MTDTTYNGWTNYETWLANIWLGEADFAGRLESGDLCDLSCVDVCVIEEIISEHIELMTDNPREQACGLGQDLMRAAISAININELARAYFSDLEVEG